MEVKCTAIYNDVYIYIHAHMYMYASYIYIFTYNKVGYA